MPKAEDMTRVDREGAFKARAIEIGYTRSQNTPSEAIVIWWEPYAWYNPELGQWNEYSPGRSIKWRAWWWGKNKEPVTMTMDQLVDVCKWDGSGSSLENGEFLKAIPDTMVHVKMNYWGKNKENSELQVERVSDVNGPVSTAGGVPMDSALSREIGNRQSKIAAYFNTRGGVPSAAPPVPGTPPPTAKTPAEARADAWGACVEVFMDAHGTDQERSVTELTKAWPEIVKEVAGKEEADLTAGDWDGFAEKAKPKIKAIGVPF